MDQQWGVEQLQEFIDMIDQWENLPHGTKSNELLDRISIREPAVQIIMDAVDPQLRSYAHPSGSTWSVYWRPARRAALTALGLLTVGGEAKRRMQPDAPELAADRFHHWVWEAARPMWNAGSWQTAVLHAAQSVNARLQQKLVRQL